MSIDAKVAEIRKRTAEATTLDALKDIESSVNAIDCGGTVGAITRGQLMMEIMRRTQAVIGVTGVPS